MPACIGCGLARWTIPHGIDERIRAGFNAVRINVSLSGPEHAARYEELAAAVDAHCPVLDLFRNPVPVERKLVSAA